MSVRDIAFLGSRFFALYIVFEQINIFAISVGPLFFSRMAGEAGMAETMLAINFLGALVAFFIFWFKADWIATKIAKNSVQQMQSPNVNWEYIQNAGFAIVGMFMVAKTIPLIASQIALFLFGPENHKPLGFYYIQLALEFGIGVRLILGASKISRIVTALRGQ